MARKKKGDHTWCTTDYIDRLKSDKKFVANCKSTLESRIARKNCSEDEIARMQTALADLKTCDQLLDDSMRLLAMLIPLGQDWEKGFREGMDSHLSKMDASRSLLVDHFNFAYDVRSKDLLVCIQKIYDFIDESTIV